MDLARIQNLKNQVISSILEAKSEQELEELRITYLGRRGEISNILKEIPSFKGDQRVEFGRLANDVKNAIEQAIEGQKVTLSKTPATAKKWLDVTAPGKKPPQGHLHPVTQIIWELTEVYQQMGYQIMEGPEVETEHYNFTVLNIPPHHPARDLQDTFWLTNGMLPRTHTSAMQVRVMEKLKPPFKVAIPGWVFRCEREDATHASSFHHYEGFAVAKNISFADLKGTLYAFLQKVLGSKTQLKFRASYFPYVEPCAEISASCPHCQGRGCPGCGGSGWLEILGAGMIHPVVLRNARIDPRKFSGFAFCPGPTRLAMIKYGIDDIRLFSSGDLRFLQQF